MLSSRRGNHEVLRGGGMAHRCRGLKGGPSYADQGTRVGVYGGGCIPGQDSCPGWGWWARMFLQGCGKKLSGQEKRDSGALSLNAVSVAL